MDKVLVTLRGAKKMQEELQRLKNVDRPQIIAAIASARSYGDLSENAEYDAAKDKQGMTEAKIAELEDKISRAEIIDPSKITSDVIRFGATVTISENGKQQKFQIVGSDEADVHNGLLPVTSPLAIALMGRSKDDSVEVTTPGGTKLYEVLAIEYL